MLCSRELGTQRSVSLPTADLGLCKFCVLRYATTGLTWASKSHPLHRIVTSTDGRNTHNYSSVN